MSGEIIRMGDKTSHGGIVLEGSAQNICMGKPIAFIGHKVFCPLCKGAFPIVEGAPHVTFYGRGVALAGMHTSCGAVLIATQFSDTVSSDGTSNKANMEKVSSSPIAQRDAMQRSSATKGTHIGTRFDDKFVLVDDVTETPLSNTEYAIQRRSGKFEHGVTDAHGHTHMLSDTEEAEDIEIFV
jgi:uncharacterized Zn-binding protein involved in type VI secretion